METVQERELARGLEKFLRMFREEQVLCMREMGKEIKGGILNIAVISGTYLPLPPPWC